MVFTRVYSSCLAIWHVLCFLAPIEMDRENDPMTPPTWYLLIHRLPVRPLYLRARIRRLLTASGAVPLKKAVYALPKTPQALERLTRVAEEARAGGGEAFVCESTFTSDREAESPMEAVRRQRSSDYAHILRDARTLLPSVRAAGGNAGERLQSKIGRIRARLDQVRSLDPFPTPGHQEAQAAIDELERTLQLPDGRAPAGATEELVGRTWVTRRGLHVDRLACAWVVRRLIDPAARFRFADAVDLRVGKSEVTFDTPGGHFAHEEGRCSVETLLVKAGLDDPAAQRIAEIVHDLDLEDDRFRHPETAGIGRLIDGIVEGHDDDRERLDRGLALFDDLYRSYRKKALVSLWLNRPPTPPPRLGR